MRNRRQNTIISVVLLALAAALALVMGMLMVRRDYLTRGISQDLPEPIKNSGVRIGLNVQLEQYNEPKLQETLNKIKDLGFEAVKQSFYFDEYFDWTTTEKIISAVTKEDMTIVPLLDGDPARDFMPPDPNSFAEWAAEFARRYGSYIDYYIVWDEPNLTSHWGNKTVDPVEYAAILSATAQAIRSSDPTAIIITAPLAPTVETGPKNLADHLFLQALYKAGIADAFDVVAGKPYGFNSGPDDREVNPNILNFSRVIMLREVMERNGDSHKPIWAGNWGWNSLPSGWQGRNSIWGQVDEQTQANWTTAALTRARKEWPWMGYMFLENWEPTVQADDPRWGFNIAGRLVATAIDGLVVDPKVAYPGYYGASQYHPAQEYQGEWRFSNAFGADIGATGDSVTLRFWGSDIGLRVRRSDTRARFYVLVDGQAPNNLPKDERGSFLVLNSPDTLNDYITVELIAKNLDPGEHTLSLVALHETEKWTLDGFSVGYKPPDGIYKVGITLLGLSSVLCLLLAIWFGRLANWGKYGRVISASYQRLNQRGQILVTTATAILVAVAGWLTWGEQAGGIYRRIGESTQLALTAAAASIFYISPSFLVYLVALAILFMLIFLKRAWGLALVAFSMPFYVQPKTLLGYRFSPVEIFLLVTATAFGLRLLLRYVIHFSNKSTIWDWKIKLTQPDLAVLVFSLVATMSLFFTNRIDVAMNEWRVVIIEPAIFYLLLRLIQLDKREMWVILDAFVLGGVVVAIIGLIQYVSGQNLITAEGGLLRLRSIYGSPNNVALYLGRIIPILFATLLAGQGRRRIYFTVALVPLSLAMLLTFSKGAFFLGLPASLLIVILLWRRSEGQRIWPWLIGAGLLAVLVLMIIFQIPQLAGRLDPQGETGFFRMNLWRSSLNMFVDHPIIGVGLDNFLYEYRGRYIFDAAWQEPNLNHPHNIILDFATRLGILGLIAGSWLLWSYFQTVRKLLSHITMEWLALTIGLMGSWVYMVAHGFVDHSFFLVDLSYAFYLLLGIAVWLSLQMKSDDSSVTIY